MASWQAHTLAWLCKQVVKRPLAKSTTVETIRRVFNASQPRVPRDCTAKDDVLGGIRGEWMTADGVPAIGTMMYIHGGAFVACSPKTHRPFTSWFARQGWRVFAPGYRLAPEHRFPAPIDDCISVYRALLTSGVDPKKLVVAGDSAGGNLALALSLSLRANQLPQPAALALFSPVVDFTWSGASIRDNSKRCAMFSQAMVPICAELYLGDHDRRDPLASPFFADLAKLPPMIFQASEAELLRDESVRMAERAKQAGIDTEIKLWPVVPHIWQIMHRWIPEGREALAIAQEFLLRHVAAQASGET